MRPRPPRSTHHDAFPPGTWPSAISTCARASMGSRCWSRACCGRITLRPIDSTRLWSMRKGSAIGVRSSRPSHNRWPAKVLYRRGGLRHGLRHGHGLSHRLGHDLPGASPIVPPACAVVGGSAKRQAADISGGRCARMRASPSDSSILIPIIVLDRRSPHAERRVLNRSPSTPKSDVFRPASHTGRDLTGVPAVPV
jgi:hypothetical protein